jgi:hypothetical protein
MEKKIFTKLQKKHVRVDPQILSEIRGTRIRSATLVRIAKQVFATKSQSEKEDEEVERLQKPSPKKKPPRKDKSRRRVKIKDKDTDKDPDLNTKDMSMNYKIVGSQLETLWFKDAKEDLNTVRRKEDGEVIQVSDNTLKERGSEFDIVEDDDEDEDTEVEEDTETEQNETSTENAPEDKEDKEEVKKEEEKEEANTQGDAVKKEFSKTLEGKEGALDFLLELGDDVKALLSENADTLKGVENMKVILKEKGSLLESIQDALEGDYGSEFMDAVKDVLGEGLDTDVSVEIIETLKKVIDEGITDTPVKELAELSVDELEQRILDEAELKDIHTEKTKELKDKYKKEVREKFESLSDSDAGIEKVHSILAEVSNAELSYFSSVVKEPMDKLEEIDKSLEDKKEELEKAEGKEKRTLEKEIKALEQEKGQLEESLPKLNTVKNMVNVNAILRGEDSSIVGEVSDKQKSLISFLGDHLPVEGVLDSMSQIVSVSEDSDKEVESKTQMQLAIGNSMKDLSMDQKMSVLMDQKVFDDNKIFIEAFNRYAEQAKSPLITAAKRKELEDMADMMFSRAMAETLAGSEGTSKDKKDKKPSSSFSSKEKAKERSNLLNSIGKILEENLGSFLSDPDQVNDADISGMSEGLDSAIQAESIREMYRKRMENASEGEKQLLQKKQEEAVERMMKKAKIRSNLTLLWGKI